MKRNLALEFFREFEINEPADEVVIILIRIVLLRVGDQGHAGVGNIVDAGS